MMFRRLSLSVFQRKTDVFTFMNVDSHSKGWTFHRKKHLDIGAVLSTNVSKNASINATNTCHKKYDFIVFGASGYTGRLVVEELVRVLERENFTMAVADMSEEKNQSSLDHASQYTGKNLQHIPKIVANTGEEDSITDMCKSTKVVLNCVGPYLQHGEQVVKACIENGTHHIDTSGEPLFLERMQLLYHGKAKKAGIYVVGGCGAPNAPCDLGLHLTKQNFKGEINSIDCYMKFSSGPKGMCVNVTTLESSLHGFERLPELKRQRKILFPEPLPKPTHVKPSKLTPQHRECKHPLFDNELAHLLHQISWFLLEPVFSNFVYTFRNGFHSDVEMWGVHSPSSEKSIIQRSLRHDYITQNMKPVAIYVCTKSFIYMILMLLYGNFLMVFGRYNLARQLIIKYPRMFTYGVFTRTGPCREQLSDSNSVITFIGRGWQYNLNFNHNLPPYQKIISQISGPDAYSSTAIFLVQCCITLLRDIDRLPKGGGVYTVSTMFNNTSLVDRLNERGIKFEVLSEHLTTNTKKCHVQS